MSDRLNLLSDRLADISVELESVAGREFGLTPPPWNLSD